MGVQQIKKVIKYLLAVWCGDDGIFQASADIAYLAEHSQNERIKSSWGIFQVGSVSAETQQVIETAQPFVFVFIEGNESIAYGNLPQSPLDMDELPPKGFWKQQTHTPETGAAAYNAAGTGCGEAKQVLTVETVGLQVDVQ